MVRAKLAGIDTVSAQLIEKADAAPAERENLALAHEVVAESAKNLSRREQDAMLRKVSRASREQLTLARLPCSRSGRG